MPCRCGSDRNCSDNSSERTTVSSSNISSNGANRCSGSSFWPEFANLPRNFSSNGTAELSGCCSRCSRR